ncbi:hypothetical protein [Streptacidiphilus jiangxiensis]|uniref:Uncharacterized protein n=1 Tax=Streptacidiphilus jiangxiensis TaxID=235985 RepID=A0A1H7MGD2_STRJI|nr:hypothetical protein [Streptacidiphilus jiangxiensis]SEL10232.1 hypothetical protein SAMN05414137_105371 [Streptacidiphilus jiangxiensis]
MAITNTTGGADVPAGTSADGRPWWIDYHAGPGGGAATRHLQAAAHLDRTFRDRVITELVEERHRVPAPAPGIAADHVLAECLRARRLSLWTAAACTLLLVIGLAADWASALVSAAVVVGVFLYGAWVRFAEGVIVRFFPFYDSGVRRRRLRLALRLTPGVIYLGASAVALIAALVTALYSGGSGGSPLDGQNPFGPGSSDGGGGGGGGGNSGWVLPLVLLVGWILIGAVSRFLRHQRLSELADPARTPSFGPTPASLAAVFERLRTKAAETDTVYGDFQPFVGSGVSVGEWSLQTELRPATVGAEPGRLTVSQLHEQIAAWVRGLSSGVEYPGDALHSLAVGDRVLRSGLRMEPHEAWFDKLTPAAAASAAGASNGGVVPADGGQAMYRGWIRELDADAHPGLRHYVESRAELWNGQLVVSTFVRVSIQGHQLYVEGLEYVLPPVAARYRAVDLVLTPDGLDAVRALWAATTHIGRDLGDNLAQVVTTAASLVRGWFRRRWRERMLAAGRKVQQGPRVSVRELGAEDTFEVLFQFLDSQRVLSAVRERALTATLSLLKQQGYNTEQFEAGAQNININNGIQNYDSEVSGAQAAGSGARARSKPSVPKPRMGAD